MLIQNIRDLVAQYKKIRADTEALEKQNTELAGKVREKVVQVTVECALSKAVAE